ncbi:MAG: carboxymuconolactone decarboxylase family protein [Pseudomonadota bacterium]
MTDHDLKNSLASLREARGYLLPHHGLLATALPDVLTAYDDLYRKLAFETRDLTPFEHEFVWLTLLAARGEPLATHHLEKFRRAGGTPEQVADIVGLASVTTSCAALTFAEDAWSAHVPNLNPATIYLERFRQAAGEHPLPLAHLGGIAALTGLGDWRGLRWQLLGAYADDTPEAGIAHAMALAMFPGSVPYFARAAGVWQDMIRKGEVSASARYQTWAEFPGQGGYNEASGKPAPP